MHLLEHVSSPAPSLLKGTARS